MPQLYHHSILGSGCAGLGAMSQAVTDPAFWSRLQFAFTVTYHYLFPQLTMGLVWFIVWWKWRALKTGARADA